MANITTQNIQNERLTHFSIFHACTNIIFHTDLKVSNLFRQNSISLRIPMKTHTGPENAYRSDTVQNERMTG